MIWFLLCYAVIAQENFVLSWTGQHSGYVRAIALSPDGSRIYSGGDDKTLKAWNAANGNLLWTRTHDGKVNSIDVSSDGKYVLSASSDKSVRMWDAETGAQLWIMVDADVVIAALFCAFDTRVMIANEDNQVKCLYSNNGNVVWIGNHDSPFNTGINFLSISGNKNFAVSGSDRFIKVWNITTQSQQMIAYTGSNISAVYFNKDWTKVLSSDWSGNVRMWNAITGAPISTLVHGGIVNDAKYSPDGTFIVSIGSNKNVRLWNAESGQLIWTKSHNDEVVSVAFSPDGSRIATGGGVAESIIRIWDTSTGNQVWESPVGKAGQTVSKILFSPDGNKLYNANYQSQSIKCWTKALSDVNKESNSIPNEFYLFQNYPNPFNPTTTINYTIANVGSRHASTVHVMLKVYDLLGKEVKTLVNENKEPGRYVETFHGTSLPSGIYFYRLTVSNTSSASGEVFTQTRKMILIK